jgi:hypothetical protein
MTRSRMLAVLAIGLVALAAACGPPPSVDAGRGSGSPEPSPCPAEPTQPPPVDRRVFPEERMAARQEGISVEKFQRQEALGDEVARLAAALEKNEPDTYAELELDYGRKFRVIVYSTGDGEETVLPYVRCTPLEGFVEVRTVEASIAELKDAQNEAHRIVTEELGVRADSDINITKNRAEIYVTDKERLEAALRESGQELPEHVEVVEVGGLAQPM